MPDEHQHHLGAEAQLLHPLVGQHRFAAVELTLIAKEGIQRLGKGLVLLIRLGLVVHAAGLQHAQVAVLGRVIPDALHQAAAFPVPERLLHSLGAHAKGNGQILHHAHGIAKALPGRHKAVEIDLYMIFRRRGHVLAEKSVGYSRGSP